MQRFRVEVISQTSNPQQVIYAALHQDYSESFVFDEREEWPSEAKCGEVIVKRLLAGDRGHFGPIEHPQIVLNCGYFPHSVMQQVRTHRVGISFDVQCLAANTEITFISSAEKESQTFSKTIGELYALWTTREKRDRSQAELKKLPLRVLNEATKIFEIGYLKAVVCSGIQPIYRVTLEDGKNLDCTVNHRLFTSKGWQTMGEAVGLVTHPDRTVDRLTKDCQVMCNGIVCEEIQISQSNFSDRLRADLVKVQQVEYLGEQMTYDLEIEDPWHNFVANGMVVHNSNRYTGQRIVQAAQGLKDIEDVFYLRPVGHYFDRQGKRYDYTQEMREKDLAWCLEGAKRYQSLIEQGVSEEHARGIIPFDVRQHFVMSVNARSLMHLLDLRWKGNAQLEAQKLCELIVPHFEAWMPAIAQWYFDTRAKKARLAP